MSNMLGIGIGLGLAALLFWLVFAFTVFIEPVIGRLLERSADVGARMFGNKGTRK